MLSFDLCCEIVKIKLSSATILKIEHEKGFLNIWQDNEFGVKEMVCLENLSGHISSVRALSLCPSSKDSISKKSTLMFSAGGRAQLLVWRLTIRNSTSIVTENLCMHMIGQTQKKGKTRMWKLQQIKLNPETRFMDLSSVQLSGVWCGFPAHLHLLVSACSDAFVR